jgi:hypothetical protein
VGQENRWTALRDIASQLVHAPELTGFDVVQVMTPKFFNWKINDRLLYFLKRHNRALVAVNTACTSDYHRRAAELRYSPCAECKDHDLKSDACIYDRADEEAAEYATWKLADAIVSTHFEYDLALRDTHLAPKLAAIPLPINTRTHGYAPLPATAKVRIWYGETRKGFKGGRFIAAALDRLAATFGNDVEIVRTPRLEFAEYLSFLDTVHIVIDQVSSYGLGMNALYAAARGRVVLTGAEPEQNLFAPGERKSPFINAVPDKQRLYDVLASLVLT